MSLSFPLLSLTCRPVPAARASHPAALRQLHRLVELDLERVGARLCGGRDRERVAEVLVRRRADDGAIDADGRGHLRAVEHEAEVAARRDGGRVGRAERERLAVREGRVGPHVRVADPVELVERVADRARDLQVRDHVARHRRADGRGREAGRGEQPVAAVEETRNAAIGHDGRVDERERARCAHEREEREGARSHRCVPKPNRLAFLLLTFSGHLDHCRRRAGFRPSL